MGRFSLCYTATLIIPVLSQLTLPNPAWLPPTDNSLGDNSRAQWGSVLGDLLFFYEAQRSGKLPDTNRVQWRNDSSLDDGRDVGLDLTGGYYDAGDYVKFTYPLSFSLMSICWGALDYGSGYDRANQTAYLDSMLRWGLDWLIKAHPSDNTLYVQVGDASVDNAYWGGDRGIPTPRYAYQINQTAPGTDTAASASSAFSACSLLYSSNSTTLSGLSPASLQNSSYSDLLRSHADALHTFASKSDLRTTQTSVPELKDAYASSGYGDELALSALFLAWLTNSTDHYKEAEGYYSQYKLQGEDGVLNWDDEGSALPVLFAQVLRSSSVFVEGANTTLHDWQANAEAFFDRVVDKKTQAKLTKGGLLWYTDVSDSASLNPALNMAMLMTRYAGITNDSDKASQYLAYARSQLDYSLGDNPMSAPYIVGVNSNSPKNPHSAISSGGDDIGNIDTSPKDEAYVLYGGVVGGPNRDDRFWDLRGDWLQGEVALDYNAPMLTLAAAQLANDTSASPFFVTLQDGAYQKHRPNGSPCDAAYPCSNRLPLVGKIVMGVVISVVGIVILLLFGYWILIGRGGRTPKS